MDEEKYDLELDCMMEQLHEAEECIRGGGFSPSSQGFGLPFRPAFFNLVRRLESLFGLDVVHDFQDVLEHGVDGVLARYSHGCALVLSASERALLKGLLLSVGGEAQTREMALLVESERPEARLNDVPVRRWSLREEEVFRKVQKAALSEQHSTEDRRLGLRALCP